MKILFAASEAVPYIKTGGMGDVVYALPCELAGQKDMEISVILPYYKSIKENPSLGIEYVTDFTMPLAWRNVYVGIFKAYNKEKNITYYFIDNDYYFKRNSTYGDYDDGERFAFFSKAVLECMQYIGYYPDIIHCNDWQTALVPLFFKAFFAQREEYCHIKTMFTIHNIEYQGKAQNDFLSEVMGVSEDWRGIVTYHDCINFMKSAIVLADKITTVSETYSHEIRHAYFAHGLEDILRQNEYKLVGITNGIDLELFNPETDKTLYTNFSAKTPDKKYENKRYLQQKLELPVRADVPMIAMISRLVAHKGLDLVKFIGEELLARDVQFVVVGTGEAEFEDFFKWLTYHHPDKIAARIVFDPVLANQVYAGADLFLMPSKSEPCGLSQLIAMRYGTIPIVRETGGLFDTVPAYNPETGEGRGCTFKSYNAHDMLSAVDHACAIYHDLPQRKALIQNVMRYDSSWENPARKYMEIYQSM